MFTAYVCFFSYLSCLYSRILTSFPNWMIYWNYDKFKLYLGHTDHLNLLLLMGIMLVTKLSLNWYQNIFNKWKLLMNKLQYMLYLTWNRARSNIIFTVNKLISLSILTLLFLSQRTYHLMINSCLKGFSHGI